MSKFRTNDPRLDGAESIWFSRQLEFIYADLLRIQYPELKARKLIPKGRNTNPASKFTTFRMADVQGALKIIQNYATDLPRVGVTAKEESTPVHSVGGSLFYSMQDIRAGAATGVSLENELAIGARGLTERTIENLSALGDSATGIQGFLNHANVPATAATTVSSATTWAAKQALNAGSTNGLLAGSQAIYNDLALTFQRMASVTKGVGAPNAFALPPAQYAILENTPFSQYSGRSILGEFLAAHPGVTVEPWYQCIGAGAGATDMMVAYKRDDGVVRLEIPMEFTMYPPQPEGLGFNVPFEARVGGVVMPRPLELDYTTGL